MLSDREAGKSKTAALGTCTSMCPIYVTGNHKLYVLEFFKGDRGGVGRNCQVEGLTGAVLPQAISISDGVWAVVIQRELELSKVCEGKPTKTLKVTDKREI